MPSKTLHPLVQFPFSPLPPPKKTNPYIKQITGTNGVYLSNLLLHKLALFQAEYPFKGHCIFS